MSESKQTTLTKYGFQPSRVGSLAPEIKSGNFGVRQFEVKVIGELKPPSEGICHFCGRWRTMPLYVEASDGNWCCENCAARLFAFKRNHKPLQL